jgi:hypothetical protein
MAELDPSRREPEPRLPPDFDERSTSARRVEADELREPLSHASRSRLRIRERFVQLAVLPHRRTLVAWAPGILPLVVLPLLIPLMRIELNEPLFSDTYVFQYTGWCIRHGLRLYRDVGMADGPFIHFFHVIMQILVGLTERSFRKADLAWEGLGGSLIGLLLAPNVALARSARIFHRALWAAAGMAVWLSWYMCMEWQATTQRESYYALFGSVGMVLLYASAEWTNRRNIAWGTAVGAFLVCTQLFGKPTGLAYVGLGGISVLLADAKTDELRRLRLRTFGMGVLAAFVIVVSALLIWGDISGYFLWCWKIPWRGNRFLFGVNWYKLLLSQWDHVRVMALSSLFVGIAAIAGGLIPRRSLGLVLGPAVLWLGACLQARGFNYHTLPVYAATYALVLTLITELWRDCTHARWLDKRGILAALALAYLGQTCIDNYHKSPYRWGGDSAQWYKRPRGEVAAAEQEVGLYLRENTQRDDRIFAYSAGENAHILLFYARRRTAAPFFHSFWLDPIGLLPQSAVKPDPEELAALERLQAEIRETTCGTVQESPPEVIAFNLLEQAFKVCPNAKELLAERYEEVKVLNGYHIYFRKPAPS